MKTLIVILLLTTSAMAADCVPQAEAVKAWSEAVSQQLTPRGITFTHAVCTPCSCPVNGMASCYEYMAAAEREKIKREREQLDLLERAINFGICTQVGPKGAVGVLGPSDKGLIGWSSPQ